MGGTARLSRVALAIWTTAIVVFLMSPILLIVLYAFNPSNVQSWPLDGLSTKWFSSTFHNEAMREALWLSVRAALISTTIAVVLGSMAAFAVHRFRFFGRETVSFLLVLPLALPGIITGMALNSFFTFGEVNFSLTTIVIGHATFCIVTVYNNLLARLRRTQASLVEASMDLGADGWQTFRHVTLPWSRPPSSPARCSRSRSPSTRSSSPRSPPAPRTPCRSGSSATSASDKTSSKSTSSSCS